MASMRRLPASCSNRSMHALMTLESMFSRQVILRASSSHVVVFVVECAKCPRNACFGPDGRSGRQCNPTTQHTHHCSGSCMREIYLTYVYTVGCSKVPYADVIQGHGLDKWCSAPSRKGCHEYDHRTAPINHSPHTQHSRSNPHSPQSRQRALPHRQPRRSQTPRRRSPHSRSQICPP